MTDTLSGTLANQAPDAGTPARMKAFLLRGLHPHHQLDVHQHVKWLKVARALLWRRPISL
jgi:hypothetical protein